MKSSCSCVWRALLAGAILPLRAADLTESTFTQVVNDVQVAAATGGTGRPAKVNDLFHVPEIVRTGAKSRAELKAPDQTLTRIGANSVFSFEPASRNMKLERGSILFHSPAGKGGGTIKTAGASASVLGTTLIVSATADGGFKVIALEGTVRVKLPGGASRVIRGGEMTFVLPGSKELGPVLNINMDKLVSNSNLVGGFANQLPSQGRIEQVVRQQIRMIATGRAKDTGVTVGQGGVSGNSADPQLGEIAITQQIPPVVLSKLPLERDVTLNSPALTGDQFLPLFTYSSATLPEGLFGGFVARNLSITAPVVNVSQYGGPLVPDTLSSFDLFAANQLQVTRSVSFTARSGEEEDPVVNFRLVGARTLKLSPGVGLSYDNPGTFELISGGSAVFSGNTLQNPSGDLSVESRSGSLTLQPGGAAGHIGPLTLTADRVATASAAQDLTLLAPVINAAQISLSAGNQLNVDAASFRASPTRSLQSLTMEARTIVLQNVQLPGNPTTVTLRSQNGQLAPNPNTGQTIKPGFVNFIRNVMVGDQQAQHFVRSPGNPGGHIVIEARNAGGRKAIGPRTIIRR